MLRVQRVHGLGEISPGPNTPDPTASSKAWRRGWCPHPAGIEGDEERAEEVRREGRRRQLSACCLSTGKPEGQRFLIFYHQAASSSHCSESAAGLACACDCSHCTVRSPPAFPPFLQYTTVGYSPWLPGAPFCCLTYVLLRNNVSGNCSFQLRCGEHKAL